MSIRNLLDLDILSSYPKYSEHPLQFWFFNASFNLDFCVFAGDSISATAEAKSTGDYMAIHADKEATSARNGYNPLLDDFSNTSFFIGQSKLL